MFDRIAVPLDGSSLAESILPHVTRMIGKSNGEVILVHAVPPLPYEVSPAVYEGWTREADEGVRKALKQLEGEGVRATLVARDGAPEDVVRDVVKEKQVTLLAMATHGRTGVERLVVGSVAETLLRESDVPVYLVRPWGLMTEMKKPPKPAPVGTILVPVDLSDRSATILKPVLELAKRFDAGTVLVHALDPNADSVVQLPERPGPGSPVEEISPRDIAHRRLEEEAKTLQSKGYGAKVHIEEGDPASVILSACDRFDAGLIAMATHGRTGISRLFAGSVTEEILRRSQVPVFAIRSMEKRERRPV